MADATLGAKNTSNPFDYDRSTLATLEDALKIDAEKWNREIIAQEELFVKLHRDLPGKLCFQCELRLARL